MRYCQACVLPDTRPNLVIGDDGLCGACRAHRTKPRIDWAGRARAFEEVVNNAQRRSPVYDCLIPVSGGKDSTWQVKLCLDHGLKPLTVTWKTPGRTEIGQQNLDNLIRLGVDHIDYQINPEIEKRFMLEALDRDGDPAIPMHLALFNIPLNLAVRLEIPLVVWGENSAFEYGGDEEALTGFKLDSAWLAKYGVTHGTTAADWIDDQLTAKDLTPYFGPKQEELDRAGVLAVFLGYYFPWDPYDTFRAAQAVGFSPRPAGPKTGYYNFADIDCDYISVHHWLKWYKFGFTRLFDNLALEIRNGRRSRPEAIEIIRGRGDDTPHEDIHKLCAFLGITSADFFRRIEKFRNTNIWTRTNGKWVIEDFLIPDWKWT